MYSPSGNGSSRSSRKNGGSARSSQMSGRGLTLQTKAVPSAKAVKVLPRPPTVRTQGRMTIISGHEQIASVNNTNGSFGATRFFTNPGLSQFAWLSARASGFEKYRYRKFCVHYVPDKAVTTTAGSLFLAADFDPTDDAPGSLADMSTYEVQSNDRVFEHVSLNIPVSRMFDGVRTKKVRSGPVPGDLQIYDGATFSVCTYNGSDTAGIGQIWVDYEIELISPQVEAVPVSTKVIRYTKAADQTMVDGVGATLAFDTATTGMDSFGSISSGTITLPRGFYRLACHICCSNSAAEATTALLSLTKNGSTITGCSSYKKITTAAADIFEVSCEACMSSTGSDTAAAYLTMTGAAGTMKMEQEYDSYFEIEAI